MKEILGALKVDFDVALLMNDKPGEENAEAIDKVNAGALSHEQIIVP